MPAWVVFWSLALAVVDGRSPPPIDPGSPAAVASAVVAPAVVAPADDAGEIEMPADAASTDPHWRLETAHGPVHVWVPAELDVRRAAIVVYVHGYWTHVDDAWANHNLAAQFRASGVNAVFVVPEAPASLAEPLAWKSLRALLREVTRGTGLAPKGPLVVVGHSGAYRSISRWLANPRLRHVVLLDALYGEERAFRHWLSRDHRHHMTIVGESTAVQSRRFARTVRGNVKLDEVPADIADLPRRAAGARVLYARSQYPHMAIVSDGAVIPVLLRHALPPPKPARVAGARPRRQVRAAARR